MPLLETESGWHTLHIVSQSAQVWMTKIQGCKLGLKREAAGTKQATGELKRCQNAPTRSHSDARQTEGKTGSSHIFTQTRHTKNPDSEEMLNLITVIVFFLNSASIIWMAWKHWEASCSKGTKWWGLVSPFNHLENVFYPSHLFSSS